MDRTPISRPVRYVSIRVPQLFDESDDNDATMERIRRSERALPPPDASAARDSDDLQPEFDVRRGVYAVPFETADPQNAAPPQDGFTGRSARGGTKAPGIVDESHRSLVLHLILDDDNAEKYAAGFDCDALPPRSAHTQFLLR